MICSEGLRRADPEEIQAVVTVFGVLKRRDRMLLIERGGPPDQGLLTIPGGHKRPGERLREACLRELREETGLAVLRLRALGYMEVESAGSKRDFLSFYFMAEEFSGACRSGAEGRLAWMTLAETQSHPQTHPAFQALSPYFFMGRAFTAVAKVGGAGLLDWTFEIEGGS